MFAAAAGDQIMLQCPPRPISMESKWKPNIEVAPSCPRCASSNTKFCYYNNYSLSQPRYFCKGCRRYWTKGGSLRNVPVGGGCRKTRRSKSARSASSVNEGSIMANHGMNFDGFDGNDSLAQISGANNGPDIDLAAVFAKFLNNDQELAHMGDESTDASQSATPDSAESDSMIFDQSTKNFDTVQESIFFEGWLPNYDNNIIIEDNREEQINLAFEMQNSLINNDQAIQLDALWCDASENDSWQPVVQLQDLDSLQEFMNISENNFSNNNYDVNNNNLGSDCNYWSSFDLSTGFDDPTRP